MGAKKLFSNKDVEKRMWIDIEAVEDAVLARLRTAGEEAVAIARSNAPLWQYVEITNKNKEEVGISKVYYRNGKKYIRRSGGGTSFTDWTANLRNSIGYVIFKDGKAIVTSYPDDTKSNTGKSGNEGKKKGIDLAMTVGKEYAPDKGWLLVITAGMEYAAHVEAGASPSRPNKYPYDVISGGTAYAAQTLETGLKELINKLNR